MTDDPLLHFDLQPEAVNTECDDGQKEPLDIIAEQLTARTVKNQTVSVKDCVVGDPALFDADRPWCAETERDRCEKKLQDVDADES